VWVCVVCGCVCGCVWCVCGVWVCVGCLWCACVVCVGVRMGLKHATTHNHLQVNKILFESHIGIGLNLSNNNNPSIVMP